MRLPQQGVFSYETEAYEPDVATLKKIADYFNTSVDYFVGNTDIRRRIEKINKYDLDEQEKQIVNRFRVLPRKHKRVLF